MLVRSMLGDEEGATMVEYGLLIATVAIIVSVAVMTLGQKVSIIFSTAGSAI
jgi:pilus assembly protein Flp/PilA